MKHSIFLLLLTFSAYHQAQTTLQPEELLERAIAFHDPQNNWPQFNEELRIVMSSPNAADRDSRVRINLPADLFSVEATRSGNTSYYQMDRGKCSLAYNGQALDSTSAKEKGMSCERALLYKNYYTYLYGLPMKLRDPGANINHPVEKRSFKGKEYLVLKVTYDPSVGSDIWFFYLNPETYAMEIYQFFKRDDSGELLPNSGEYILLEGLSEVNGIQMPKVRSWYYNKNDALLGTDTLVSN